MGHILMAFAFGTVWFWLISVIWIALMFWGIESVSGWGSGIIFVLYLVFLQYVVRTDLLGSVIHNPLQSLAVIVGYLILGISWSFVKWWLFVHKEIESHIDISVDRYISGYNRKVELSRVGKRVDSIEDVDKATRDEFDAELRNYVPKVKDNKDKVTVWIMYWPLSAIWSLVNDFIKRFIRALITKLQGVYARITESVVKSFVGIK